MKETAYLCAEYSRHEDKYIRLSSMIHYKRLVYGTRTLSGDIGFFRTYTSEDYLPGGTYPG